MKHIKYILAFIFSLMLVLPIQASGHQEGGKVDAKDIVFHHVQDAYEWHITSWGDKHRYLLYYIVTIRDGTASLLHTCFMQKVRPTKDSRLPQMAITKEKL